MPQLPSASDRSVSAFLACLYNSQLFRASLLGTLAFSVSIALDGGLERTLYIGGFFVLVLVVSYLLFRAFGRDWFFRYERWR